MAGILADLTSNGLTGLDLTDNELAKSHIRHAVGGHAPSLQNERVFRFEFPERPGALMRFLEALHSSWNISLFHYRNHGTDYGRVLVGIQVPRAMNWPSSSSLPSWAIPWWKKPTIRPTRCFWAMQKGRTDAWGVV